MPELTNRDELEAQFARKLAKLSARHRRELIELLGNPPDINNVPPEFWVRVRRETEEEAFAVLMLIFTQSMIQHGWSGPIADISAEGWATQRADEFATQWTKTSQERLESIANEWRAVSLQGQKPTTEGPFTVQEPSAAEPFKPAGEPGGPNNVTNETIRQDTLEIFGPDRVALAAENETTIARHQGAETAVGATVGTSGDDIWRIEDDRACKTCSPLNGKPRVYWERFFPEGPPSPHPRCRCFVEHVNMTNQELATF